MLHAFASTNAPDTRGCSTPSHHAVHTCRNTSQGGAGRGGAGWGGVRNSKAREGLKTCITPLEHCRSALACDAAGAQATTSRAFGPWSGHPRVHGASDLVACPDHAVKHQVAAYATLGFRAVGVVAGGCTCACAAVAWGAAAGPRGVCEVRFFAWLIIAGLELCWPRVIIAA